MLMCIRPPNWGLARPHPNHAVRVHRYKIDGTHSSSWKAWKHTGSPQQKTVEQYAALEKAGKLEEAQPAESVNVRAGVWKQTLDLLPKSFTPVQLVW